MTNISGLARQNEATFHHSMKRRCFVHDYKGRSIYLITLEVAGRRRLLGRVATALRPAHLTDGVGEFGAEAPCIGSNAEVEIPLSVSGLSEGELKAVNAPLFEPSELGRRVVEEFMKIGEHVAGVKPLLAQAMPDHFHGILFVTREINRSLGSFMAGFKGKCSQIARELGVTQGRDGLTACAPNRWGGAPNRSGAAPNRWGGAPNRAGGAAVTPSLWEEGYHDRILTSAGQLEKMFRYVIDNPRRLALRLKYPDLFTSVRCLAGHGHVFEAFGNGFLLQRDTIAQVQCSRRFFGFKREEKRGLTPGSPNHHELKIARNAAGEAIAAFETVEFAAKKASLFAEAKKGAVLCSPCISDGEKAIAYAAVDAGHSLIVLRNEPFPPRFKPSGRFFDACAEGRLLMLYSQALTRRAPDPACAPNRSGQMANVQSRWSGGTGRQPARITRGECLALNALVVEICGGNAADVVYQSRLGMNPV